MIKKDKGIILVSGASGFIGSSLCSKVLDGGWGIRAVVMNTEDSSRLTEEIEKIRIKSIDSHVFCDSDFKGVDIVVHLAALTHIRDKKIAGSFDDFYRVNVLGTKRLAEAAIKAGVRRFIFISSVKVNGEGKNQAYTEKDIPMPEDFYGKTKLEAEKELTILASKNKIELVILRFPLVYGPAVKANFNSLIKLIKSGLPLPFKNITNRRSFIYLDNAVNAIFACLENPFASGETFLVSDGEDISTPDLIKLIAFAMNKKPFLFSLHPALLKTIARITGSFDELEKLTRSLFVDSSKIRRILAWSPPFSLKDGMEATIKRHKIS